MLKKCLKRYDPPSHTGRKHRIDTSHCLSQRSTLPYREETISVYAGFSPAKHLVVQFAQKLLHVINMSYSSSSGRFL